MIVGFTGGRALADYGIVVEAVHLSGFSISAVVSGACGVDKDDPKRDEKAAKGADGLAEQWAKAHSIPIRRFYAAWKRLGLKAGPIRNSEMAQVIEALISLPGNRGTADMTKKAKARGIPTFVMAYAPKKILGHKADLVIFNEAYPQETRIIPCVSLRQAERNIHLTEQQGFDVRIMRDPLRVVATKKGGDRNNKQLL